MTRWLMLIAGIVLAGMVGCSHTIHVRESLVTQEELLPAIRMSQPVAVVARCRRPQGAVEFCKAGPSTFDTDFVPFTDYAVASLTDIFTRNGILVTADATKRLTVSVSGATCEQEASGIKFTAYLDVSAGNGLERRFSGFQRIWKIGRAHV